MQFRRLTSPSPRLRKTGIHPHSYTLPTRCSCVKQDTYSQNNGG